MRRGAHHRIGRLKPGLRLAARVIVAWSLFGGAIFGLEVLRASGVAHHGKTRRPERILDVRLSKEEAAAWRAFPDYSGSVPVLCYHGIVTFAVTASAAHLDVPRPLFFETMLALKIGGFHAITLRQYVAWYDAWREGRSYPLPSKPILLTFDDGRDDSYRVADRLLRRYGFHAVELAVPGWVKSHPGFSLQWSTMRAMDRSGTWTVQEHFGYGHESVPYVRYGTTGGRLGYLEWIGNVRHGHLESLSRFLATFHANMEWGEAQLRRQLPDYEPLAMAVPSSDEGQNTNTERIKPRVVRWLDDHYQVVFTGDYLYGGTTGTVLPYRLSKELVFRIQMNSALSLAGFRCRLADYVANTPPWKEYLCPGMEGHKTVKWTTPGKTPATTSVQLNKAPSA